MESITELMRLDGRVAVITGGAGHLGRTFGETFAELGAIVVLVDARDEVVDLAKTLGGAHKERHLGICFDLSDTRRLPQLRDRVVEHGSRVDMLINNVAFTGTSTLTGWSVPPLEQEEDAWRATLNLNLTVPFRLSQLFAPALQKTGNGAIINIASIYGLVGPQFSLYKDTPMGNPAAYNASKAGLLQLTRYFATALAPHVRVNAISPGGIARGQPEAFMQRYCERTPLGRMARESDFKGALAYLGSDLSRYVTGHNLVVDGGWTIW